MTLTKQTIETSESHSVLESGCGVSCQQDSLWSANIGRKETSLVGPIRLPKRKAAALGDDPLSLGDGPHTDGGLFIMGASNPEMKIRRTMSRCAKSYHRLDMLSSNFFSDESAQEPITVSPFADPLFCLGSDDSTKDSPCTLGISASLLFPSLPTAVSESSCSSQTSLTTTCSKSAVSSSSSDATALTNSDTTSSVTNKSYGWFVVLDEDLDERVEVRPAPAKNLYTKGPCESLAFVAPTAPKGTSAEEAAELAYAQAADTVDDIFGGLDF